MEPIPLVEITKTEDGEAREHLLDLRVKDAIVSIDYTPKLFINQLKRLCSTSLSLQRYSSASNF